MTAHAPASPRLGEGLSALAADKDLVLCDVWGVIHNGVRFYDAAVDALCRFRRGGGLVVLITNAPVPEAQVRSRLDRLGVTRDAYDRVATAGDVTVDILVAAGCPPIFNIGPDDDVAIYAEAARLGPRAPPHVDIEDAEMAVCIGFDATGDKPEDYDGVLARLLARKLTMICANPDIVVEVGDTLVYCAGAVAERYGAMGGAVLQTGKPHAVLYERAIALAEAIKGPTPRTRILAVGDAIATDVLGAARQEIDSVFITAGIHRAQLHEAGARSNGAGDLSLDRALLAQFLGESAAMPTAAMPRLSW